MGEIIEGSRQKEIMEENSVLRRENEQLQGKLGEMTRQMKQKDMHVYELLDKIKRLESEIELMD